MSEHHHTETTSGNSAINFVAGVILIAVGATVLKDFEVPVPGLDLNLGITLAMIGMMLVLFPVIKMFYTAPLEEAIHERNSSLEKTFAEAEELRETMNKMRTDYERKLAQTEAEAREQIQAQIKEAQQLRQTLMGEATAKADELVKRANQEIEAERSRVMSELRLEVVNLTLAATEKLLGENVDSAKNRKLVEEFIDKIEVKA